MRRLIAVSNRVGPIRSTSQAGGLAVAVGDALREHHGFWFGFSGKFSVQARDALHRDEHNGLSTVTLDLPVAEYEAYYNGYSNGCLWPLFHFRADLLKFSRSDYEAYLSINARMAQALAPLLKDDDVIWVHDYHLIPFAQCLRKLGCRSRIGFFLHVPFPARDLLLTLPTSRDLLEQLSAYDLVGVQTAVHLERLHDCVNRLLGAAVDDGGWLHQGHRTRTGVYPVGIDVETFQSFADSQRGRRIVTKIQSGLRGRGQIIGVDRLDYSKGLLRRIEAFERYLEATPRASRRVEYLQIAPVSRGEVGAYQSYRHELELAAARINGRFSTYDWTPLRYLNSALTRPTLAAIYRASRIGFVTPLRDGMNLVAKEYIAAQDAEDPGVLVLSEFAGAARQMTAAVLANPYDAEAVAIALETARVMPRPERRERHADLMRGLKEHNARHWQRSYLGDLEAV